MRRFPLALAGLALLAALAGAVAVWQGWLPWPRAAKETADDHRHAPPGEARTVTLSEQARQGLGLITKSARPEPFWKKLEVPATIIDRPGVSDRGVIAPVASVVAEVHAFPGDTVRPGEPLFTLRLVSEYVQAAQGDLYKTSRDADLNKKQIKLLEDSDAVPAARLLELKTRASLLDASLRTLRHTLLSSGLTEVQVDQAQKGEFVTRVVVVAPRPPAATLVSARSTLVSVGPPAVLYEVQELKVELGQKVDAGQLLASLGDHRLLFLEGRAYKHEVPVIEKAATEGWPLEADFGPAPGWSDHKPALVVRSLANTFSTASRTLAFHVPLENQSRAYSRGGKTYLTWRYRPGSRARLLVPTERLDSVFVLPRGAVARDGAEAYVFRENGDQFDRKPVVVLYEDSRHVVLANDGSVAPGVFLAWNGAEALNRALKAQSAAGGDAGGHWHADGTFHRQ